MLLALPTNITIILHRFPDKLSILYALLEMYRRARFDQIAVMTDAEIWANKTAEDVLALNIEIMFSTADKDNGFIRLMERQRIVNPVVCQLLMDWYEHIVGVIAALMAPHAERIAHDDITEAIRYTHGILRGALMWSMLPLEPDNPCFGVINSKFKQQAYKMAAAYLGLDPS